MDIENASQMAVDVLIEIAEDKDADVGCRISAACAILDRLDTIQQAKVSIPA